jgi:hydrogenase expression/formation protein HypC
MCIGIPMQVIESGAQGARCRAGETEHWIDTLLVGEVAPGDWLLCALGVARERIDSARAASIAAALHGLSAVLEERGDTEAALQLAFADLLAREPELPPHLRPQPSLARSPE